MHPARVSTFKSKIINGGKPFSPDVIEIDDTFITLKNRKTPFSALQTISIPLRNIINIKVSRYGFGATIFIESFSKRSILGKGFSVKESLKIKKLLQDYHN